MRSAPESFSIGKANADTVNRTQLEHIIRAAAANADTTDIVIIGSQAVLAIEPPA